MFKLGLGLSREGLSVISGAQLVAACWGWGLQQQWRTALLLKRAEPQG